MNFQVTLEECPCETFTNVSAVKCWEMVLQRLNQEIIRHSSIGERGLPSVHALQSVNGLEMFGFLSPPIIQVKLSSFILAAFILPVYETKLNPCFHAPCKSFIC